MIESIKCLIKETGDDTFSMVDKETGRIVAFSSVPGISEQNSNVSFNQRDAIARIINELMYITEDIDDIVGYTFDITGNIKYGTDDMAEEAGEHKPEDVVFVQLDSDLKMIVSDKFGNEFTTLAKESAENKEVDSFICYGILDDEVFDASIYGDKSEQMMEGADGSISLHERGTDRAITFVLPTEGNVDSLYVLVSAWVGSIVTLDKRVLDKNQDELSITITGTVLKETDDKIYIYLDENINLKLFNKHMLN